MVRVQAHGGPDDHVLYLHDEVGLAMRCLSIIDLVGGHQPFVDDGRCLVSAAR